MNTHQKVFFTCAVSLGFAAAAFSAPAPVANIAAPIELPTATVIGHRTAPEISLEPALVVGHRNASMVASRTGKTVSVA
jgi:hypothetical protein